jgi:hypothetical protein
MLAEAVAVAAAAGSHWNNNQDYGGEKIHDES